tara:strand:+ start:2385 stop:2936 length:552 start_codon:yes stop_codon:yes gene_type:complete
MTAQLTEAVQRARQAGIVTRLREQNKTFKEIASELGMTVYLARKLFDEAARRAIQEESRRRVRQAASAIAFGMAEEVVEAATSSGVPEAFLLEVERLELSHFLNNQLYNAGIIDLPSPRVGDIAVLPIENLLSGPGFGKKSLASLQATLVAAGSALGMIEYAEGWKRVRSVINSLCEAGDDRR